MPEPVDLPANVAANFLHEATASHQRAMEDIRGNTSTAHNIARLGAVRNWTEYSIRESRADSGLIATPIASPTTGGA
jgi:hypothetical protein